MAVSVSLTGFLTPSVVAGEHAEQGPKVPLAGLKVYCPAGHRLARVEVRADQARERHARKEQPRWLTG
jgi:hypothetical protein